MRHELPPEIQQLQDARAATTRLSERDQALREAYDQAMKARVTIAFQPPPIEDVVANMRRLVDAAAEHSTHEHHSGLLAAFGGGFEMRRGDGALQVRRPRLYRLGRDLDRLTFQDLCALIPDQMKTRLESMLRAVPYEHGPSLDDRAAAVAEADQAIAAAEDAHTRLVDAAGALDPPIALRLLPSVAERRQEARLDAEANEGKRRRHEEQKAALDSQMAARAAAPKTGMSNYIDSGGAIRP